MPEHLFVSIQSMCKMKSLCVYHHVKVKLCVTFGFSYYAFVESKDSTYGTIYLALGIVLIFRSIINVVKGNQVRKEMNSISKDPPSE